MLVEFTSGSAVSTVTPTPAMSMTRTDTGFSLNTPFSASSSTIWKKSPTMDNDFYQRLPTLGSTCCTQTWDASHLKPFPQKHFLPKDVTGVIISWKPFAVQVNKAFWLLFIWNNSFHHNIWLCGHEISSEAVPNSITSLILLAKMCCVPIVCLYAKGWD